MGAGRSLVCNLYDKKPVRKMLVKLTHLDVVVVGAVISANAAAGGSASFTSFRRRTNFPTGDAAYSTTNIYFIRNRFNTFLHMLVIYKCYFFYSMLIICSCFNRTITKNRQNLLNHKSYLTTQNSN